MPGISLCHGPGLASVDRDRLFDAVCHFDGYDTDVLVDAPPTLVGATGYETYPVERFETEDAVVLLEGTVYDEFRPDDLTAAVAEGRHGDLADWLGSTDGAFLVVVAWTDSDRVTLLNDTFGRLPTYFGTVDGTVVASRELGFVREFARQSGQPVELDRLAAAQQLVFEHVLGTRTPFEGVSAVPPGSLVHVDDGVTVQRLHRYDFETTAGTDRSLSETASVLADRLVTACERRQAADVPTVVSLSGGLDSRVVVAGYAAADADFETVTFDKENGLFKDDARIASAIAETLGVEWEKYHVGDSPAYRSELLALKQGMNTVSMAYMLDFFETLRERRGPVTYATGDGGHRAFVDETPPGEPTSLTDLVDQLLESNARFTPDEAAELTGVEASAVRESVRDRLASYPESNLAAKYDHFMFRERGLNFIQHGEDRNRYFCWSVSPFYAPSVFRYAIACPTEHKRNRKLFAAVLEELAPELLDFDYANVGAPLGSLEFRLKEYLTEQLMRRKSLKDAVARLFKDDADATKHIARQIGDHLSEEGSVAPLSADRVADVVDDSGSYRPYGLSTLYTVVMLASDLQTGDRAHGTTPPTR